MIVFVAIAEPHNSDIEVQVFRTVDSAIAWAQEWAEENQMEGYDWRLDYGQWQQPKDWIYFHCCSAEGDRVKVEQKVVQEEG